MSLIYFDSNVCIGKRGLKDRREIWKSEDILASMDRAGIAGALVYSGLARDYAPAYGNEHLCEELAKYDRFYGCYVIAPGYTGSFLKPDEFVSDMKNKNMVAAKMFPQTHIFSPCEDVMGEYYSALEENGIPLLIDKLQIDWDELSAILSNHKGLNVLLQGATWSDFHNIAAYLKKYSNLYTDLSSMQANFAVEIIAKEFGAESVCMGSGLPLMCPGAARAFIDYAQISNSEKQLMAGGNLARLCNIPLPTQVEVQNDEIAVEASKGNPISVPVFDSHAHFLESGGNCGGGFSMVDGDLQHMSMLSDIMGVDEYCVAPWLGIWTDSEAGNLVVSDMAKRDERVYPYVLIDPNYVENIEKEAYHDHAGRNFACAESYAQLAKKYDNVYLQLTFTSVPEGVIEYLCAEGLASKTLYGTDAPMRDPRPQLGWVAFANVSVEDKKKILGGNMRKIADKCFKNKK